MPVIAILGISNGRPCAIPVCVSEERYKQYMEGHAVYEYGISPNFIKSYLRNNNIPFEEIPQSLFAVSDNDQISIWKDAVSIDIYDVKKAFIKIGMYDDFLLKYYEHLKTL